MHSSYWLKDITATCQWPSCKSRATVELMNNYNAGQGKYCSTHGPKILNQRMRKINNDLDGQRWREDQK